MGGSVIDELVNNLYEMVQDAWSLPLSNDRCVLERDKVLDVLDEIRASLPADLKMAREIIDKRNDVLTAAKKELENSKKQADDYAKQKLNEHDIVANARKKAAEIIANAEKRSREIMKVTEDYCDDAMRRAEETVAHSLAEMKQSHAQFQQVLKEQRQ